MLSKAVGAIVVSFRQHVLLVQHWYLTTFV
jgi:hypothetical protein